MKCETIFWNQGGLASGNWHLYSYNLHHSYRNQYILNQVDHIVSRRTLSPRNKMEFLENGLTEMVLGFGDFPSSSTAPQCPGHFWKVMVLWLLFLFPQSSEVSWVFVTNWKVSLVLSSQWIQDAISELHRDLWRYSIARASSCLFFLLLEKSRLYQLVFSYALQRLMNISFKIEVHSPAITVLQL